MSASNFSANILWRGTLVLLIVAGGCSPNEPAGSSLSRPQWECPLPPTAEREAGIYVDPSDNFIRLRWIIGEDPDLVGYDIHRRSSRDLIDTLFATVFLTREQLARRGEVLEWTDTRSYPDTLYFYVLFSFDAKGNRSPRSDTMAYKILPGPILYEPGPRETVTTPRPVFRFGPSATITDIASCVVRVVTDSAQSRVVWVSGRHALGYVAGEKTTVQYGSDGLINRPTLAPGNYRWRVDFLGFSRIRIDAPCACVYDPTRCPDSDPTLPKPDELSFVGSRSAWRQFTVAP